MTNMKTYGLKFEAKDPNAYVFGYGALPSVVMVEDGQWDNYLPTYEPQFNSFFDSYGCVVWGTQNAIEIMLKKINGGDYNFSERFTYILGKVTPPGSDPHHIAEIIRNNGLIDNSLLPMTSSTKMADFLQPNPMTKDLLNKGLEFPYEIKHEYVWKIQPDKETRTMLMKDTLRFSPLGVSVSAWHPRDGVYVDNGQPNNHWCVCYGWNAKGWKIFDSYDQSLKTVSFDHNIEVAKRYYPQPSTRLPQISLITRILTLMKQLLGLLEKEPTPTPEPQIQPVLPQPTPIVPPIVEPIGSKLIEWATAIRDYEGKPGDLNYKNNNPGNIKAKSGGFLKFKTWDEGWKYLLDYLTRAATGKHPGYKPDFTLLRFFQTYAPSTDKNNPTAYAKYVAKRLGITIDTKIRTLV